MRKQAKAARHHIPIFLRLYNRHIDIFFHNIRTINPYLPTVGASLIGSYSEAVCAFPALPCGPITEITSPFWISALTSTSWRGIFIFLFQMLDNNQAHLYCNIFLPCIFCFYHIKKHLSQSLSAYFADFLTSFVEPMTAFSQSHVPNLILDNK